MWCAQEWPQLAAPALGRWDADCACDADQKAQFAFLPCMHMCLCDDCQQRWDVKTRPCPMCNQKATELKRVFLT